MGYRQYYTIALFISKHLRNLMNEFTTILINPSKRNTYNSVVISLMKAYAISMDLIDAMEKSDDPSIVIYGIKTKVDRLNKILRENAEKLREMNEFLGIS